VLNHQTSLSSRTGCNPRQTGRLLLEGLAGCTSDLVTRAYFLASQSVIAASFSSSAGLRWLAASH